MPNHPHQYGLVKAAYSVKDTLELLSISRTTLYELIKAKRIKPTKLGKKTLFYARDIATLLATLQS